MRNKILFLLLFLFLTPFVANFFNPKIGEFVRTKLNINSEAEINSYYKRLVTVHQRMDGNIDNGSIIFLGDSLTQSLNVTAISQNAVNYGIGSDTTYGLLNRLSNYKSINQADAIVLSIGINDFIYNRSPDLIIDNYKKIFDYIPEDKNIYLNSLFPVSLTYTKNNSKVSIEKIKKLNNELARVCSLKPKCKYLNNYDYFSDKSGYLNKKYDVGDGIHINTKGYDLWINILKSNLNKIN